MGFERGAVALADIAELTVGGVWGEDTPTDRAREAVYCLRGIDIDGLARRAGANPPTRYLSEKQLASRVLKWGDIVIEASGSNCGRSIAASNSLAAGFDLPLVYSNFCKRIAIRDTARWHPPYVWLVLQGLYASGDVQRYRTGSAVPNLDVKRLLAQLHVPDIPIEEQRAVAEVFGAVDDRIEWCTRAKSILHDLGSSTLDQSLQEHGLSPSAPLSDEQRLQLGDVVEVLESGMRPRGGVKGIEDGVPSVGAESITRMGEFDYSKTKYIPRDFFDSMRRGHVEDFDILVYKDGGKPGMFIPHVSMAGDGYPFPRFAINDHVYRLRVAPPYGQAFMYFWLSTSQSTEEMARRGTGAAQPGLNQSNFKQVPVPRMDADALEAVDQRLMNLARLLLHYAKEQRLLAELRDALLPKLLTGELRIKDPERLLEAVA